MTRLVLVLAATIAYAVLALAAGAALSQPMPRPAARCAPHAPVAQRLTERYGEVRLGAGTTANPEVSFELWVNPDTGTWTALFVDDTYGACMGASGTGFRFGDEPIGDPMAPQRHYPGRTRPLALRAPQDSGGAQRGRRVPPRHRCGAPGEKLAAVKALVAAEDWRAALSLAAKFPRLGRHADAIRRGHEAMQRPDFQRQIGRDPEAQIAAGIAALRERYGNGA